MSSYAVPARDSTVTRALARDRIGVPSVLAFILASIAPMTVCAGVITTAYAVTGLTGIPFAFIAIAVVLALFIPGYLAMARRIRAGPGTTPGAAHASGRSPRTATGAGTAPHPARPAPAPAARPRTPTWPARPRTPDTPAPRIPAAVRLHPGHRLP
jgi:hypothetical protein